MSIQNAHATEHETQFELELEQTITHDASISQTSPGERQLPELKPTDRGRSAWQVLLAAFVFEALLWGFPTSFGIFQAYYSTNPQFTSSSNTSNNIPLIGTLAQGIYYIGAPLAAALTNRLPHHQTHLIMIGWPLCILGLLSASFAKSIPALILTQGMMYGLGFLILTYPILNMVSEWWVVRKGMAFGLISAASGLTGIVMPFILDALLRRYGYQITLRACAVGIAVLTAPFIPLLKGRLPVQHQHQRQRVRTDWSFLRKPLFWFYAVATVVQGFGFFIPPIFIPSYALAVGLPWTQGALLLAVMALSQTMGQFAFGWLSDKKLHASFLTSMCCVVAAVATATLWGLGKSLPTLMLYSILYGFFAFGFGTMRVAMGRAVSSEQSAVLATYSTFVFLQGVGNVMVGPISARLIFGGVDRMDYGASRYRDAVILVATSSVVGGIVIIAPHTFNHLIKGIKGLSNK